MLNAEMKLWPIHTPCVYVPYVKLPQKQNQFHFCGSDFSSCVNGAIEINVFYLIPVRCVNASANMIFKLVLKFRLHFRAYGFVLRIHAELEAYHFIRHSFYLPYFI